MCVWGSSKTRKAVFSQTGEWCSGFIRVGGLSTDSFNCWVSFWSVFFLPQGSTSDLPIPYLAMDRRVVVWAKVYALEVPRLTKHSNSQPSKTVDASFCARVRCTTPHYSQRRRMNVLF